MLRFLTVAVVVVCVGLAVGTSSLLGSGQGGKTVTVGASGCDYTTIQAAIDAVPDGSMIQVTAGTYKENLTIRNKDGLVLQGAGPDKVTLDGNGPQQTEVTPGILISGSRNITISGLKIANSWRGLEADDSTTLLVEGNAFEANLEMGVYLLRSQAELRSTAVRLTQTNFDGKRGDGIYLEDATGVIGKCTVSENVRLGVFAVLNSRVTIDDNTISGNSNNVAIRDSSEATITNNRITGAKYYGMQIYVQSKATITHNTISDCGDQGIRIGATGTPNETVTADISGNTVQRCKGIGLFADSDPSIRLTIQNCTFSQNGGGGIEIYGTSGVSIADCTMDGNVGAGIWIEGSGSATVTKTSIIGTQPVSDGTFGYGIQVSEQGKLIADECQISNNTSRGVRVRNSASATLSNVRIASTRANPKGESGMGVQAEGTAQLVLQNCTVSDNAYSGVRSEGDSSTTITASMISGNIGRGIDMLGNCRVSVEDTTITSTRATPDGMARGIQTRDTSHATILRCEVTQNREYGIALSGASQVTIQDCRVTGNGSQGIKLGFADIANETIKAEISRNTIQSNGKCGVFVAEDELALTVTGQGNKITGNNAGQICGATNKLPRGFGGGK
jgi:parallel beta-helix repeat protein